MIIVNYIFTKLRTVPGASDDIEKTLGTSGITFDESPSLGGQFGPYFQVCFVFVFCL